MKRWRVSLVAMVVASSVLPLAAANASSRGATGSMANSRHSAARHAHVAPSAPANVVVTAGDASVAVSWDSVAGADGYVAMADPGGFSCQTANSSCVISGLTNGTTYSITVTASAAGLLSDASAPVSATPQAGPPLAALGVTAFTIGTTATVTWLPANSSTPITGYTVTSSPGGLTCSVSAVDGVVPTTCIVTGLTAGQTYTFSVVATNSVGGSSPATAPTVTPVDTPSAPTNVSTIATSATITVSWTPSASDGGAPISGYTALAFDPVANFLLATCGAAASGTSCVMSALAPNTSYYVRVFATNAQGPSDPSLPTDPQSTAPTMPGSPVPTSLTAGNGSATVTWTAPEDNGGATITSYTATADDGNGGVFTCTVDAGSTSCLIKGLANGTSYTVTIAANNVAGGSIAVTAGVVTPASVPDAPTNITVTPASGAVTVSWSAPASDGGSAIYRFTATASDFDGNTFTCITTGSSCVITTLTNGYNYDITVVATNAVGDSVPAEGGNITPSDVPGAPIPSSLTFGNEIITASWSAPFDNGGLLITGYTATATDGDGNTFTCTTDGTSCVIDGLTNGISYNVTVVATNADGDSSSADLGSASPATTPSAPGDVSVATGRASVTVSWGASVDNGGSKVMSYTATADDRSGNLFSCTTSGDSNSCRIDGLSNGTSYSVSVVATNGVGHSAPSNAGDVTPLTAPSAPGDVSASLSGTSVTVRWSASIDNGGSPITGYRAYADNGDGGPSCTIGPDASSCTITGLRLGQTYTVSVVAINAVDQSFASIVDDQFLPLTHPSAPGGVWVNSLDGGLQINWNPANDTGGSPITNYHIDVVDPSGVITGSCDTLDLTCTVMGLANWVTYSVLAKAENAQGSSDPLTTVPSGDNARDIVAYQSGWLALTGSSVQQSDPFFDLSSINSMLSDSCTARTMAVAPDGSVWIENFCGTYFHLNLGGSVDTYNPDGWSSFAIAVAPNGDVLGTNWNSDITVFDPSNGSWTIRRVDGAACLTGIAYTPDGSLYLADPCYSQVRQLTGDPTDSSSSLSLYDGPQIYVSDAMGLASAGDGTLVVGNDWWQTATINPLTGEVNYFQSPLPCNEHLAVVQGVVITADGCWNRFGVGGVSQTTGQPQSATPSAPQNVVVQTGSHHIVVTWSAPQYNGIAGPTTSYTATATDSKGNVFSCSQAVYYACIIDGLTDGVVYRVSIVANNVAGSSAPFIAGNFMPVTASVSIPSDYQSAQPNTNNLLTSLSASGAAPMVSNLSDGASVIVSTSLGNLWMPNSNGLTPLRNTPFTSGTIIGFSGSTESVNAALQSLEIYSQQTGTFTLTIQVIDAGFAYDPVSGHAFFQANCNNCTFMDAVNGANQFSLNGVGGYLVSDSTSSANEVLNRYMWQSSFGGFTDYQPYLVDASGNPLFAYQYANNDVSTSFDNSQYLSDPNASFQKWIYVSGPHKGDIMTLGGVRYGFCSAAPAMAQNGYFANWGNGEPNDCGANEFVPIIGSYAGRWNDVGPQATLGSSVIEFGGLASDTGSLTIAHVASATGRVSSPPSQPGDVSVYARNQSLVVTVGSPSDGSGNPVTYTYVASPTTWGGNDGATCVTTDTTCTLGGLTWGQSYYVTVYASTVAGNSSWAYAGYYDIALEISTTVDGNSTVVTVTNHEPALSSAWINARSSGPTLRWCDFEGLDVNVAQICTINGLEYLTDYQLTADTSTPWGARVLAVAPISTGKYTPLYGSTPPRTFATMWNDAPQATAVDATNNVWRIANSSTVEVDSFDGTALATYDLSAALPGGAWPVRIAALPQGGAVVALNGYSGGWMSLGAIVISPTGAVTYVDGNSSTVGQVAVDPVTGNVAITSGSGVAFLDTTNLTWSNVFPGTGSVDTRYDSVAFDSSGNLWFTGNGNTSYFYEVTNPFGDWSLTTVPVPVSINYTNQVMVSVAGIFYILGGDNQVTAWNPVTNETTSLGLHNEFPQSAQWWGLNLPAVAGVGNGWIAFSVSEYGWNGGPGSTVFEMPIPVLS